MTSAAQAPQVVDPALQLCVPVPLAIAQLREPAGLEHVCDVVEAPQTAASVGVQACDVTTVPQLTGVPLGVQLCEDAGAPPLHSAFETGSPKLLTQVMARDCEPLATSNTHTLDRDCEPLLAVKLQDALRDCEPEPEHTAALHAPHAP